MKKFVSLLMVMGVIGMATVQGCSCSPDRTVIVRDDDDDDDDGVSILPVPVIVGGGGYHPGHGPQVINKTTIINNPNSGKAYKSPVERRKLIEQRLSRTEYQSKNFSYTPPKTSTYSGGSSTGYSTSGRSSYTGSTRSYSSYGSSGRSYSSYSRGK